MNTLVNFSMCILHSKFPRGWSFFNVTDIPHLFGLRPEATADNTSIRVSWHWSSDGLPMCVELVRVYYQPEGGSTMMYTVGSTTTSAILPNLQCNVEYTVWVYAEGGPTSSTSGSSMVYLPARGKYMCMQCCLFANTYYYHCTTPAPPTPTEVTAQFTSTSSVRVTWQWTSSGPAPDCLHTTTVTYRPEGGGESSLQLSDSAANETTLTDLHCNTSYTITVVATAGEHRRKDVAFFAPPGTLNT